MGEAKQRLKLLPVLGELIEQFLRAEAFRVLQTVIKRFLYAQSFQIDSAFLVAGCQLSVVSYRCSY